MKNLAILSFALLALAGCLVPQKKLSGNWRFIGFDHPAYHGNLGYTGEAAISGDEIVFRFIRSHDFPPSSNGSFKDFFPADDWGRATLEYKASIDSNTGLITGSPFNHLSAHIITDKGKEWMLIGNFDPPLLYTRK